MMTMAKFKDWLKTSYPTVQFYIGILAKKEPKCVGIYTRSNSAKPNIALGGLQNTSYSTLPLSLLVHWTENSDTCETFAQELYNKLFAQADFMMGTTRIASIEMLDPCPIDVDRDEHNIVEMVIRLNIIYER